MQMEPLQTKSVIKNEDTKFTPTMPNVRPLHEISEKRFKKILGKEFSWPPNALTPKFLTVFCLFTSR
jgi:hypothetical protein